MPIFDYQCEACRHTFEALQKVGEGALRKCPRCGKLKLKKQMAAPNFHLKGSGWYKTDFKDKPAKKEGDKAIAKSEGQADSKTESKAEGDKPDAGKPDSAKKGHSVDSGTSHKHDHGHSHSHGPGGHKH